MDFREPPYCCWRPFLARRWVPAADFTITSFDRRVRTAQQLDAVTSVECFGYVPKVKLGKGSRAWRGGPCDLSSIVARSVLRRARSAVLERSERMPHVIGITSCHGAEGKTTLAANWARFIAREGSSVLFVDTTHHTASAGEAGGLHELLRGEAALEDVIETEVIPNLDLLRSGKARGNPDLLWSNLVQAIAGRKCYQWVILDLPPLSSSADVRSAGQIIDDLLVVVEWGRTSESRIEQALRSLGPVRERVSGTIINKIPQSSLDPETLLEARAAFCASGRFVDLASSVREAYVMTRKTLRKITILLGMALAVSAQTAIAEEYRLGIGDRLKIKVQEWPDLSGEYGVTADGLVSLPLLGNISVAGLRVDDLGREIRTGCSGVEVAGSGLSQRSKSSAIVQSSFWATFSGRENIPIDQVSPLWKPSGSRADITDPKLGFCGWTATWRSQKATFARCQGSRTDCWRVRRGLPRCLLGGTTCLCRRSFRTSRTTRRFRQLWQANALR